jgi:methionine-rich copper-binding protein CopC
MKNAFGVSALAGVFAVIVSLGLFATSAQASVTAVNIVSPTTPTVFGAAPTSVDITFDVSVSHTNPYCATVEVVGVNVVEEGLGTLTGDTTTQHTVTVPIPAGTPPGAYDARVRVDEFSCTGGFSQTDTEEDVVLLVQGCNTDDGWFLEAETDNGLFDRNEDGWICTKEVNGKGNSANTQRNPGQTGFHVDGHNHKDNN